VESIQILAKCHQCSHENTLTITTGENGAPLCIKCQATILSYKAVNGYVYFLSNPEMGGLLKIGFTVRPVQERIDELNSATGVPAPFVLEAYFLSSDPQADEKEIHSKLSNQRTSGKEFFRVGIAEALSTAQTVCGRPPAFLNPQTAKGVESREQTVSQPWKSSLREKLRHAARIEADQKLERLVAENERLRQ
jgi:T5orf172 domain